MDPEAHKLYKRLKKKGLSPDQEQTILEELNSEGSHAPGVPDDNLGSFRVHPKGLYQYTDLTHLQQMSAYLDNYHACLKSIDELLEKDQQREKDGFPRKIRVGKMVKPRKGGKEKVVVVPTTVEEKFIHDPSMDESGEGEGQGGSGGGEEGEVIGEQPVHDPENGSGAGPGEGEDGAHEIESSAYDLGKILTEQFELPNLKDKGKKRSLTRYTYDLTDRNKGFGQILDKKATLKEIVETNINLGRLPDPKQIDPTHFLISPTDMIYRVLSKEKDYESQAVVFFIRDYSGSMQGKVTELIVGQHVLIYSWLLYQYARQVETRFILHDTSAKEVEDFYTYYNSKVAGGTKVVAAFQLVNELVQVENLAKENNIYIFHGTDGDDWDSEGKETIPELKKMLTYANRVGITIAEHGSAQSGNTEVEKYLKNSNLLDEQPALLRLDTMKEDATEARLIEGIKTLISE